ncbi:MAG: hypothetical protein JSW09_03850 [Pseudomonadota bacterium]|nr:MAG: hypothetical protein JSW09_03850 [Pseudomonadota bacterium]
MQAPAITTAIPRQRYQLGGYQVVALAEIESGDARRYQYILAFVRDGDTKPGLYVTCEKNPRAKRQEGSHCLRIVSEPLTEELGSSDRWADLEAFAQEGLRLGAQVLGLGDESPYRLG